MEINFPESKNFNNYIKKMKKIPQTWTYTKLLKFVR